MGFQIDGAGDRQPVFVQLGEIRVLQVLLELAFAELVLAPRLGHEGQVGILGGLPTEALGDEDVPRCVGEVFLGTDDMGDLHEVVVHRAGQMVETAAVRPLDDVILLSRPIEFHLTPDQIDKTTHSLPGHLETHYRRAPCGLEALLCSAVSAIQRRL